MEKSIKRNHGQDLTTKSKLIHFGYRFSKYYSRTMTIIFVIYSITLFALYIDDENLDEYCISVPITQEHHIKVSENNACLIDWDYFAREPIFFLLLLYFALIFPANLAYFFLERKYQK